MAVTCLKPSEYRGDQNTAVAGRIVILKHQEIQSRKGTQAAAAPTGGRKGKGGKAAKGLPETRTLRKLEAHLAATQSLSEVLYVEAWGENGDKLAQKCQVGDLVSIQGAAVVAAPAQYSTSRLHYHLNLKGPLGLQVIVQKLDADPWQGIPAVHPLVPLSALDRVRDQQQICVSVTIVENPGSVERQTKEGAALVCNAIVQQGATRVRCSFWHEQAEELAAQPAGTSLMLYQVLITKRKDERSWEIGSWRGTSLVPCSAEMATAMSLGCMMFPLAVAFLLPFAQQTLLQAGRASSPRQLPNVDGNSCEGLDWLPCHGLILERSRGSDRAWTTAKVGDGL